MGKGIQVAKIKEIADPILASLEVELVDVVYAGSTQNAILRIFIDKKGGVSLDDCENVSRHLGHAFDLEDIFQGKYTFEVSSPGINRALKKKEDYARFLGKNVKIKTVIPIEDQRVFSGRLCGLEGDEIVIDTGKKGMHAIPFGHILEARLDIV